MSDVQEIARRLYWIEAAYRMGHKTEEQAFNETHALTAGISDGDLQEISRLMDEMLLANLTPRRNRPAQLRGIANALMFTDAGVSFGRDPPEKYAALLHEVFDPLSPSERAKVLALMEEGIEGGP